MVAMTPLITIQLLGLVYKLKSRRSQTETVKEEILVDNEIFEMEENDEQL